MAIPMTPSTKPSGKAHSTFIQRRPILILGTTPAWGGNLTTNRIQSLDERANQLQNALSENEDAAKQAGLAPSTLP